MRQLSSIAELPARGRLMGIDHGTKRIGLAVTDAERSLAKPLETTQQHKISTTLERIRTLIQSHHIAALIVGYPLEMDGREGPRCQSVRAFMRNLEPSLTVPYLYWDERLSSSAASDFLQEAGLSNEQRMERIDAAAAAVILKDALRQLETLLKG
jgi:putative holliday junction resolvase